MKDIASFNIWFSKLVVTKMSYSKYNNEYT